MVNLREWALPIYTIMMQMSAGSMLALWVINIVVLRRYGHDIAIKLIKNPTLIIFVTVATAMIGSHYHLSRPAFSLFAILNFQSSWLSREVAFTVLFALLVGILLLLIFYRPHAAKAQLVTGWGAVTMGVITVYAMSRVYLLPTQIAWNSITTPIAFFCAMVLLGGIGVTVILLINLYIFTLNKDGDLPLIRDVIQRVLTISTGVVVAVTIIELGNYGFQIMELINRGSTAHASLDLLLGLYRVLFIIRVALLICGVVALVIVTLWQRRRSKPLVRFLAPVYLTFLIFLISEVLGRFLFYAVHVRTGI
ncbi:MAG: dimethyl sulfoxide reductase anchor subunit [Anaerolineae bacterium]|nr:dimethyl sulfoxide reductase anchor subunit [Anaerolineae bacterium]MCA9891622.1 dimethyl sulfoxide reductase anchor subunit [Anaerolineae bacterium]